MLNPLTRSFARPPLVGFIRLDDTRETRRSAGADDRKKQHPPAPDRVFIETELTREITDRQRHGGAQHVPQDYHKKVRSMDAADGGSGSA